MLQRIRDQAAGVDDGKKRPEVIEWIGAASQGNAACHEIHVDGGSVVHCAEVMHGRISTVYLGRDELFDGLPTAIDVVRYHSLMVAPELPRCLKRIAWLADGTVMGLKHVQQPIYGVQFHPESIKSEYGYEILANFDRLSRRYWEGLDQACQQQDQAQKEYAL